MMCTLELSARFVRGSAKLNEMGVPNTAVARADYRRKLMTAFQLAEVLRVRDPILSSPAPSDAHLQITIVNRDELLLQADDFLCTCGDRFAHLVLGFLRQPLQLRVEPFQVLNLHCG